MNTPQSVGSVENLLRTLPLPYKDEAIRAWQDKDASKISFLDESHHLLKTDIQRRAHGVLPLLIFIRIIETTSCCLCFFKAQNALQESLENWTIGGHAPLLDRLSDALTLNLASCVKGFSTRKIHCQAHSNDLLSTFFQNSDVIAHNLMVWKRWGTPLDERLKTLLKCMIDAHLTQSSFEVTDGYSIAIVLLYHLATTSERPKVLTQIKNILLNHQINRRDSYTFLLKILIRLGIDREIFFGLPQDRFDALIALLDEEDSTSSIVQDLLDDDELILTLTEADLARLSQFYILSNRFKSDKLRRMILAWFVNSTHFNVDKIISQLPLLESTRFVMKSTSSDDSEIVFTCEVAECTLPEEFHLEPSEEYCHLIWELVLRSSAEPRALIHLPAVVAQMENRRTLYLEIVNMLPSFVGLQSPTCLSVFQFLNSGCLLDAISWFVINAHRLSLAHLEWLEGVLSITAKTEGKVSQLVADILMFLVDEETSDPGSKLVPSNPEEPGETQNVWGVRAIQIQRSMNISYVMKSLCRVKIFDLRTLLMLVNFLVSSSIEILPKQDDMRRFRLEQVGESDGFARWLHCIDVVLENIVEIHVPPNMRERYCQDMPDVDENKLNVPGDILRELREVADQIIIAVHTRVLNFSGDPSLLNAALRCLRSALIIHTTQINGLLSRIRQIWHIIDNVLSALVVPASSIDLAWNIVFIAHSHAEEFTVAT